MKPILFVLTFTLFILFVGCGKTDSTTQPPSPVKSTVVAFWLSNGERIDMFSADGKTFKLQYGDGKEPSGFIVTTGEQEIIIGLIKQVN